MSPVTHIRANPRGTIAGMTIPGFPDTWEDAWLGYELNELAKGHTHQTIQTRRSTIICLARRFSGQAPQTLTKNDLRRYFTELRKIRKPGTVAGAYNDMRSFFAWLADEENVENVMLGIPRPKAPITPTPVLTAEQLKDLLDTCKGRGWLDHRDRALILLLIETGIRRTECISLNVDDLDLRNGTAAIRRGKGGKSRQVFFGSDTAQAVHKYLKTRPHDHEALFLNWAGTRLGYPGIGQIITKRGAQAGIEGLHPHVLRHSFVNFALASGIGERDVITAAGWTSGAQLARYGAVAATARAQAAFQARPIAGVLRQR
jgi:site-specific recombinase XerD